MEILNKTQMGQHAEQQACDHLITNGLKLIKKNYSSRYGEIDLIMQDSHDIVFIEVRSRCSSDYGSALETVTLAKQKKLLKTAIIYLQQYGLLYKVDCRFDIIGISSDNANQPIEWIKNAFSYDDI